MISKQNSFCYLFLSLFLLLAGCGGPKPSSLPDKTPEQLYGPLFKAVQADSTIFSDSKTFVDCVPLFQPKEIRKKYRKLKSKTPETLDRFIHENFRIPGSDNSYKADSLTISQHITHLWSDLFRPADSLQWGTRIPLPYSYVVPGGRFREIYYWDSYFTMLGLQADNEDQLVLSMIANFSYLINHYNFIPNGNRTYYLSRSQPPFYSYMIDLVAQSDSLLYMNYLPELEKEYAFWMKGSDQLSQDQNAKNNVVLLPDSCILNRYWDSKTTPRPESYREDVRTARKAIAAHPELKARDIYRNLRAAAESGWDFSSRWLKSTDNYALSSIQTTAIIPVDLNSLLYHLEKTLSHAYSINHEPQKAELFAAKAEKRRQALIRYCWNARKGFFFDYNFKTGNQTDTYSLAGVYPLFCQVADSSQAKQVAQVIAQKFLQKGGVVTSLNATGQQWDWPNGWAPLQWITIEGLANYKQLELANTIRNRWLNLNEQIYQKTYKMMEKYNVIDPNAAGGGGEYPNQDGFGWTNGVWQRLMNPMPEDAFQPDRLAM